ncbi:MAG: hypothetical protein PHD97_04375 [Bacteroidales bacterium]|nr:hypothetical protein [Bacteroidales bacterium]
MRTFFKYFILFSALLFSSFSYAQYIPVHVSNKSIYNFIDELANDGVIETNSAIKPYSRKEICDYLIEARKKSDKLSKRQQSEIDFFLKEFSLETNNINKSRLNIAKKDSIFSFGFLPPLFQYIDSVGFALLRPVYGIKYTSSTNKNFYSFKGGAEALIGIGKHWGVYANLCDNYLKDVIPAMPTYFSQEEGGCYKLNEGGRKGGDYSEMRGGIYYNWKWGHVGFAKEHIQWGDNYNGANILSGRTPSFPFLKFRMNPFKWLDFNYFHGWLVSEVIDSNTSYKTSQLPRTVYRSKRIAANMYTIKPWKKLNVSFGNSIIYGDAGTQAAYLIPFMFFKSIDHTLTNGASDNQNSQIFFNLSSRNIKHLHLYVSSFIDEFSFKRISQKDKYNFFSNKFGARINNFIVRNIGITAEYTYSYPLCYKHRVPVLTFESNKYNLGWFMTDNSKDIFISIDYKPLSELYIILSYNYSVHGNNYDYLINGTYDTHPLIKNKTWEREAFELYLAYSPIVSLTIFSKLTLSEIKGFNVDGNIAQYYIDQYSPSYLGGSTTSIQFGFYYGF